MTYIDRQFPSALIISPVNPDDERILKHDGGVILTVVLLLLRLPNAGFVNVNSH